MQPEIAPEYEIERCAGPKKRTVMNTNEHGRIVPVEVNNDDDENEYYMVYTLRGDSIRVTKRELQRLGFDGQPGLADASGNLDKEDIPQPKQGRLKEASRASARSNHNTKTVDDVIDDGIEEDG